MNYILPSATRGSFYKNRPWTPQKFLFTRFNGNKQTKHRKINLPCKTKVFGSPETFLQKGFWPPEALNESTPY